MKIRLIFSIVIMLTTLSCKKSEITIDDLQCPVTAISGKKNNVIGKWKLVTEQFTFFNPRTEDLSCQDIIYEFKSDGNLIVTGYENEPLQYKEFELISKPLFEQMEEKQTLRIGYGDWACDISQHKMTLNASPVDGSIRTFYRIQ